MAGYRERLEGGPTAYRSTIKLAPAIGDWTTLKPVRLPSKKIKTGLYGFDRLSQEELKLAQTIHYNFGQFLISSLKKDLSIGGDFFSISVEQSTYSEFLKRVYQPTAYCRITIPNLSNEAVVCIDMPIANTIINHALGGQDTAPITRKLTEIEEDVLTRVFTSEFSWYVKAFENIFESPAFKIVSSPELTIETSINPTGTFVFFQIELSVGDNPPASIWIGYTSAMLKPLLERVETRSALRPLNLAKLPQPVLDNISIPVVIDLGETPVATADLHKLENGDIVSLGTALKDFISVFLGDNVMLLGQPGVRGEKLAVRMLGSKTSVRQISPEEVPVVKEEKAPEHEDFALEKGAKVGYPNPETLTEEEAEEEDEELEEEEPLTEEDFKI